MKVDYRSFGRTGPAHVLSCGCDVLPWIDCGHTAWDSGLSLDRVIERQQEEFHFYSTEPTEEAQPAVRPKDPMRDLLVKCRLVASWYERGKGKRGKIVRPLLLEIDAALGKLQ